METCTCGLKRGDHVIIVGWDGEGSSGCWVGGMKQHVGISDIIYNVDHETRPCTATLTRTPCVWQTEWLQKVEPYILF